MSEGLNHENSSRSGSPDCSPVLEAPDTVATQDMPTEPGLYWASCHVKGQYDSVVLVYGEQPCLKTRTVRLPLWIEEGTPMHKGFANIPRYIGPKVVIPVLGDT